MALLFLVREGAWAQQVNSLPQLTREAYLRKSENQKQGSVLLVVLGCTIGLVGGLVSVVSSAGGGTSGPPFPIVPVALGAGCIAGGVALSKASARNKQKALDASAHFNFLSIPTFRYTGPSKSFLPAISLQFTLN